MSANIAVIGKAGSGKTTAAEWLVDIHGYERFSFAAILKDIAAMIWGESARTDRDKLQRLGVAVREIDQDAWLNAALRPLRETDVMEYTQFVCDDCRFPNEYWGLKELGFVVLQVQAPEITRVNRLQANGKLTDLAQLQHESETALDDRDQFPVDRVITNNNDQETFEALVTEFLEHEANRT